MICAVFILFSTFWALYSLNSVTDCSRMNIQTITSFWLYNTCRMLTKLQCHGTKEEKKYLFEAHD